MNEEGTIYYFAYGANMNFNTFLDRCVGAKFVDAGTLEDHRIIITSRGVATVLPELGERVYGIIWKISEEHEQILDMYEGIKGGFYTKQQRSISYECEDNRQIDCLVYVATDDVPGKPRAGYLEDIIKYSETYRFPKRYMEHLLSLKERL